MADGTPHTYQLVIRVAWPFRLTAGKLGQFEIAAGTYVYTGSAKWHLEARIARHLRREKSLRWHIDYLLTSPGVSILNVRHSARGECDLNQATPGAIPIPGFGASDCRRACSSHLKRIDAT